MILLLLFDAGVTTAVAHSHWDTFSSSARTVYLLAITVPQFFGAGAVPSTEPAARGNGPSPRDWNAALCMCMGWGWMAGNLSLVYTLYITVVAQYCLTNSFLGGLDLVVVTFLLFFTLDQGHSHGMALCPPPALLLLMYCCPRLSHRQTHHYSPQAGLTCHFYYRTIISAVTFPTIDPPSEIWQQPGKNILR